MMADCFVKGLERFAEHGVSLDIRVVSGLSYIAMFASFRLRSRGRHTGSDENRCRRFFVLG